MVDRILATLPVALAHWDETDPVLARLARARPIGTHRPPKLSGFASLVQSLVHQQVSVAAGRTIYARLGTACGGRITPERVLAAGARRLQAAGVSRQKRDYILDLAKKVRAGRVDLRRLARASDADAVATLTEVRGIGEWTAKMFLLFHLQRPDVLAEGDLGLQLAAADAYGIPMTRAKRFLTAQAPAWSPHGSLASLVLWRSRDAPKKAAPSTNDS